MGSGSSDIELEIIDFVHNQNMEPTRAERQTVSFFDGLQVDGYRMPDGEFRVGITGASVVLGYSDNWLQRVLSRESGRSIKALRGLGFTEEFQKVVSKTNRGEREAQTISLRDFNRLISYAVFDGKKAALALQLALTEVALNDFFRDAFGESPLSIDEKRRLFYEAYARTISPEDWRQMDRAEILRLALPGDELHLQDGRWNQ
jgi:hypothetical protein